MRKLLLFICGFWICSQVAAQLAITVQVPPTGVVVKPQLWNVSIANTGNARDCILSLSLTNVHTNQVVLTANSKVFTVANGINVFMESDVSPIQYQYPSNALTDQSPDGVLNIGDYNACYTLSETGHGLSQLQQECIELTIQPVSPPLLVLPAEGDTLYTSTPQFTWIPPAPLNMFSSLNYDFVLVEVLPDQTTTQAIQNNIPVYTTGGLSDVFLAYPVSYQPLDTGKLYGWQVTAKENSFFAGQSEIGTFRIVNNLFVAPVIFKNAPYYKIKNEIDGATVTVTDSLKIVYDNDAADSALNYSIIATADNNLGTGIKSGLLPVVSGPNYLTIALPASEGFFQGALYIFQVISARGERRGLRFIYNTSTN